MGRYRFLLSPRWIIRHLIALALAVALINLGLWQLRRLDQKRSHNRLLDSRATEAIVDVGADPSPTAPDALAYRQGAATGTYRSDEEVLVRARSLNGEPGAWVLTPLDLGAGRSVVVNRGWIQASGPPTLPPGAEAPTGQVSVRGLLMPSQHRGRFGPRDPATGRLPTLARADLTRLQSQVDHQLYPLYLQLAAQEPAPGDRAPTLLPAPERTEGPHFSYAMQWFLFTVLGVGSYILIIRRTAKERAGDASLDGDAPAHDGQTRPAVPAMPGEHADDPAAEPPSAPGEQPRQTVARE